MNNVTSYKDYVPQEIQDLIAHMDHPSRSDREYLLEQLGMIIGQSENDRKNAQYYRFIRSGSAMSDGRPFITVPTFIEGKFKENVGLIGEAADRTIDAFINRAVAAAHLAGQEIDID